MHYLGSVYLHVVKNCIGVIFRLTSAASIPGVANTSDLTRDVTADFSDGVPHLTDGRKYGDLSDCFTKPGGDLAKLGRRAVFEGM